MKLLFDSLEAMLTELRDQQIKVVRISPAVEQEASTEPGGIPSLVSRVIATAVLDERLWAEWRYRVGRGVADIVERGLVPPEWLRRRSDEALAIIAQYVDHEGFDIREGIVAHDTAAIDTFRLPAVAQPCTPSRSDAAPGDGGGRA